MKHLLSIIREKNENERRYGLMDLWLYSINPVPNVPFPM